MELSHIIILALVQALTEFLPVSSSGHLGLAPFFFGWEYQGVTFDLALHFGTLMAVLIYYRRDLIQITASILSGGQNETDISQRRLGWGLIAATIPAIIIGGLMSLSDQLADSLRIPWLIAINLIVFGLLLWAADRFGQKTRAMGSLSIRDAWLIGCAQVLALVPGVSRSGITMTAGLALGLSRTNAAHYTFLLSVPITAAACAHGALKLWRGSETLDASIFLIGAGVALFAGLGCIHFLIGFLRRGGMLPFVLYRCTLGLSVLVMLAVR